MNLYRGHLHHGYNFIVNCLFYFSQFIMFSLVAQHCFFDFAIGPFSSVTTAFNFPSYSRKLFQQHLRQFNRGTPGLIAFPFPGNGDIR